MNVSAFLHRSRYVISPVTDLLEDVSRQLYSISREFVHLSQGLSPGLIPTTVPLPATARSARAVYGH